jgi:hypothetical protein
MSSPVIKEARERALDPHTLGDHLDRLFRAADTSGGNEQVPNTEPLGWKECVPA